MDSFEAFVTTNFDALTFGAFFACLFVLGALELVLSRTPDKAARRSRWPANVLLTALNLAVLGILPVTGLTAAYWAEATEFGLLNGFTLPFAAVLFAGFLARSLVSYLIHVAMHKVPVLWRVYRVHHTDTEVDVSTTVRFHPAEFVISVPLVVATIAALGIPPLVVMLYEIFDAVLAVVSHANVRLPRRLERVLQWVVVTPAMHRVHHSSHQPETDSNYGATLSLWDRVFRTYRVKTDESLGTMRIGLDECQDVRSASLAWLLSLPLRTLRRADARTTGKAAA